jgi:hypothetical protein
MVKGEGMNSIQNVLPVLTVLTLELIAIGIPAKKLRLFIAVKTVT